MFTVKLKEQGRVMKAYRRHRDVSRRLSPKMSPNKWDGMYGLGIIDKAQGFRGGLGGLTRTWNINKQIQSYATGGRRYSPSIQKEAGANMQRSKDVRGGDVLVASTMKIPKT